jgi:hypothetical protein
MAAQSKACVCGCSHAGIVGSNPAGGLDIVSSKYFVLSGGGLYDGPIPRPENSFRVCVCVCVCACVCVLERDQVRQ